MYIRKALETDLVTVQKITHVTIKGIYPRYYPAGAVDYFLAYHSPENIAADIASGNTVLAMLGNEAVGTVTVKENEIGRLFVLSQHQGQGYGKALLEYAEKEIFRKSPRILLHSSLPAKGIYIKYGYKPLEYHILPVNNGDYLCYDVMEKIMGH